MKTINVCILFMLTLFACSSDDSDFDNFPPLNDVDKVVIDKKIDTRKGSAQYILTLRYGVDPVLSEITDKYKLGVLTKEEYDKAVANRKNDTDRKIEAREADYVFSKNIWELYEIGDVVAKAHLPLELTITVNPPRR